MLSAGVKKSGAMILEKFRPPEADQKILVAVSGGLDSMVLLHALRSISSERNWRLTVAHFNHQLRGRESDGDESFVRKTAAAMKLPFAAGHGDVKEFGRKSKLSIEMAARKLRHEFFARTARQRKIKTIALAHHADDQVELFFVRLLRGAGGGGLSGMKWRSPSPVDKNISLVRPLLDFSKAELEVFARENKILYREDATNASMDFLRNQIRHELLPLLRRKYQPALNKTILRAMEIVGAESDFIDDAARSQLAAKAIKFEELPVALQRHCLKAQLVKLGLAPDFDLIELLRTSPGQLISAFGGLAVLRDERGRIDVREHKTLSFDDNQLSVVLAKQGRATFDGAKLSWRFDERYSPSPIIRMPGTEFFDADKAGGEIVLRHWREGDRFYQIGANFAKKLQDIFTNEKIPRERRHKLVIAESDGKIFWVEGLRISENFKVTPETKRVLVWKWRR